MDSATIRARLEDLQEMRAYIQEEVQEARQANDSLEAFELKTELRRVTDLVLSLQAELFLIEHPEKRACNQKKVTTRVMCPTCHRYVAESRLVLHEDVADG